MASPRTISDEFNEENYYSRPVRAANDEDNPKKDVTRNVVLKNRTSVSEVVKNPRKRLAANDPRYRTTDEAFNAEYAKKGLQPLGIIEKKVKNLSSLSDDDLENYYNQFEEDFFGSISAGKKGKLRGIVGTALKIRTKIRVTKINIRILSTCTPIWCTFQLPLAIASTAFFGVAIAFYQAADNPLIRIPAKLIEYTTRPARWVLEFVFKYIGIGDINFFMTPLLPFMITLVLLMSFAIIQFLVIYLFYKLSFLNPIFGKKGSGLKAGMVLLYFIGYLTPVLNIFPWFLPWIVAVWIHPK